MKKFSFIAGLMTLPIFFAQNVSAEINLPKTEILGAEYYCYEVGKGESLYGIAKKFGWDEKELVRLNPNVALSLNKGEKLYYPTGKVVVVSQVADEESADLSDVTFEPIRHVVKKGDTVYAIARLYNISVDTIYQNHPSAKYKIREGEVIEITQNADAFSKDGGFYFYNVKPGDTLYALAKKFNTTVEQILSDNPGVSERNFKIGDNIRIAVNSKKRMLKTELVDEERVAKIDNYKVQKNDTWSSVAEKTGASVEELREANADIKTLSKNEVIAVPVTETIKVEREVVAEDPREQTSSGIAEIYDEVHNVTDFNAVEQVEPIKIVLLVEDPGARREQEFTKGALIALNRKKGEKDKLSFTVVDASQPTDSVISALTRIYPNVIITTHEKKFPSYLKDYCNSSSTELINVFDLKSEDYLSDPSVIQYLTPSTYFTEETADFIKDYFPDRTVVFLGNEDKNDALAEAIKTLFKTQNITDYTIDNLSQALQQSSKPVVFYAYPTDRKDVAELLDNLSKVKEENPFADFSLIGRPNWIIFADNMADKFFNADVYFPSRFYYPADSADAKQFDSEYTALFDGSYIKSYPVYPVIGYDVMTYLIDELKQNEGDFNRSSGKLKTGLQNNVVLNRASNWGGFYNKACFFVRYAPFRMVDRIKIK